MTTPDSYMSKDTFLSTGTLTVDDSVISNEILKVKWAVEASMKSVACTPD